MVAIYRVVFEKHKNVKLLTTMHDARCTATDEDRQY